MVITRLEELDHSKFKVYIDGEYAFFLYQKEIEQFKLAEEGELSQILYEEILYNTVLQHAKQKAMSILKFMDRTEFELRKKLEDAGFTGDIIDKAIEYLNHFGYINDERLASAYTRARMNKKSKLVIKMELSQKGIKYDVIDKVLKEEYDETEQEDPELTAIKKAIAKKTKDPEHLEYEDKQKLLASLYRKGFDISKIKQIL